VRLLGLPIADHYQLGLKDDLKNLCLVCKEMRDVGTPLLYKDMVVNVNKLSGDFQQVIKTTKDHSGLPHIRTLRVTSDTMREPLGFARYKAVSQLLSAIPPDTLTRFQ
jgi:hypothetical protein